VNHKRNYIKLLTTVILRGDLQRQITTYSAISRSLALSIWMRRSEHAFNRLCASCLHGTNTASCFLKSQNSLPSTLVMAARDQQTVYLYWQTLHVIQQQPNSRTVLCQWQGKHMYEVTLLHCPHTAPSLKPVFWQVGPYHNMCWVGQWYVLIGYQYNPPLYLALFGHNLLLTGGLWDPSLGEGVVVGS